VLVIALTALGARPSQEDQGLTASIYDEGDGGAATLRRLIDALGVRTVSLEGDRFQPELADERVLFMLRPSELVTVQDVAALRAYVDSGGTVVIAHDFEPLIEPLLDGFDVHFGSAATTQTFRLSGVPVPRRIYAFCRAGASKPFTIPGRIRFEIRPVNHAHGHEPNRARGHGAKIAFPKFVNRDLSLE